MLLTLGVGGVTISSVGVGYIWARFDESSITSIGSFIGRFSRTWLLEDPNTSPRNVSP